MKRKNQRSFVRSDETTTTHRPRCPKHPPHLRNPKPPTHRIKQKQKIHRQYKESSSSFKRETRFTHTHTHDSAVHPTTESTLESVQRTASRKLSYNSSTNPGASSSPPTRASSSSASSFVVAPARSSPTPRTTARDAMTAVGEAVTIPMPTIRNRSLVSSERPARGERERDIERTNARNTETPNRRPTRRVSARRGVTPARRPFRRQSAHPSS